MDPSHSGQNLNVLWSWCSCSLLGRGRTAAAARRRRGVARPGTSAATAGTPRGCPERPAVFVVTECCKTSLWRFERILYGLTKIKAVTSVKMVAVKYNIERKLTYVNASKLLYDNVNHKSTTTAKVSCTFSGYCYDERQNKPDGPRTG